MLGLGVLFILALLPIIWLVFALIQLKMPAHVAAFGAFVVAAVLASFVWHMSPINLSTAALEGVLLALWPIVIVIIAAVYTYNLSVHTKAIETIKAMLTSVSTDKRILALLIAWCFGGFLEGMAGFGTAVAIPASMLVALGFNPFTAILSCLIANGVPTMFGSIGIPTTTLATITGLDPIQLATTQALQVIPFVMLSPILIVCLVGNGPKALKGVLPITLISGASFCVGEVITARFVGPDLPMVVASVLGLVVTFICALFSKAEVPADYRIEAPSSQKIEAKEAFLAWLPFILIFVVLVLTSKLVPAINAGLAPFKSVVNIYAGNPEATLTFSWINTPGVWIFLCGSIGALFQKAGLKDLAQVLLATCKQMSKTILTMLCVLACAKIMSYSGMIASIALFLVTALGSFYPLVSPLLGGLGTFVTGSGTSSSVLFGTVQLKAAEQIGHDPYWLCAANSLGISFGKMISPQNIAIGAAACGLTGKDGKILAIIAKFSLAIAALMALCVFAGTSLGL